MIDAGDGRRISDVLLAQGRRVPDTHCAGMPDLLDYRGLDTPFPFTLTLPQWGTERALAVYLDARGVWVRHGAEVTAAGQSTDEARVQVRGAWHTARYLVGTDGAASPDEQHRAAGCRQPGLELAAMRTVRLDSHATHSVTVIPAVN